jgi:RHS repeat-associated protein
MLRRYVYAGTDEPVLPVDASGTITYLHHDHQGSLIAQTDGTGTLLNKNVYSPFGEASSFSGSIWGYTGQRFDAETGLYYYKARHYNSVIGRFLQPDPLGYAAGMNLYGYVLNDPVNRTDPSGLDAVATVTGNKVEITLPVFFMQSGSAYGNIKSNVDFIENAWTGKFGSYDVTLKVRRELTPGKGTCVYR